MSDLSYGVATPGERLSVPIFPLSTVVLFPDADCPLHIFEPRYRQMTRAALDGAGWIGMVTVRPEHAGEMAGDPAVFPIGCLGKLVQSEELPDGRFNIVLHGTTRFRITVEPPRAGERLYRAASIELLAEEEAPSEEVARLRETVASSFGQLVQAVAPERADEIGPQHLTDVDDAIFVGVLVQVLNLPPVERQGLLESNGVAARLRALESLLRFQLAGLATHTADGPAKPH